MIYTVNGYEIAYHANGEKMWGEEKLMLSEAIDLTALTHFNESGYAIETFLDPVSYGKFQKNAEDLLVHSWKKAGIQIPNDFQPDQYHTLVSGIEEHLKAVQETKLLHIEEFPIPIAQVEERISTVCNTSLHALNPFDGQSVFHFRVIRPKSGDNNPLHRDVWLEDYDDCINLYIPVAGSNKRSSLILIPGSHHWPESRIERTLHGAMIGTSKFNVPAVTAIQGNYIVERPDPGPNEVLVFSPYLIHGGAVNLADDQTRISLEVRLWRR